MGLFWRALFGSMYRSIVCPFSSLSTSPLLILYCCYLPFYVFSIQVVKSWGSCGPTSNQMSCRTPRRNPRFCQMERWKRCLERSRLRYVSIYLHIYILYVHICISIYLHIHKVFGAVHGIIVFISNYFLNYIISIYVFFQSAYMCFHLSPCIKHVSIGAVHSIFLFISIYTHMYICMCTCIHSFVWLCVCVYLCLCVRVFVCVFVRVWMGSRLAVGVGVCFLVFGAFPGTISAIWACYIYTFIHVYVYTCLYLCT